MNNFKFFKDKLKEYCATKEEQQIIENAFIRMLDQHDPEPKKNGGFTYYDCPGCCHFCGRLTCNGGCFK